MDRLIAVFIVIAITAVGFIVRLKEYKRLSKRIDFTTNYRNKFVDFLNSLFSKRVFSDEIYMKLTMDVNEMQTELGSDGILAYMRDPLRGMEMRNYQLLINLLPKLRGYLSETAFMASELHEKAFFDEAAVCEDMFIRHLGALNSSQEATRKKILNPIACFIYGTKAIIAIPFMLFHEFGILPARIMRIISNSFFVKLFIGLVSLVGFVSAIITIVIGWDEFVGVITRFIQ